MTTLPTLPCRLVERPYKGMSLNVLRRDIELDIIAYSNEKARHERQRREWPVSTGEPLPVDPESRTAP